MFIKLLFTTYLQHIVFVVLIVIAADTDFLVIKIGGWFIFLEK